MESKRNIRLRRKLSSLYCNEAVMELREDVSSEIFKRKKLHHEGKGCSGLVTSPALPVHPSSHER